MSTRSKILIVILPIIVILAGGAAFFVLKNNSIFFNKQLNTNQEKPEKKPDEEAVVPKIDEATKAKIDLQRTADFFIERYGSYSNQSDYENITELKPFMTRQMQVWADNFVKKSKMEQDKNGLYHGFSTKVLNSEIESSDYQQTVIKANCQRQESIGDTSVKKIYYQEAEIIFLSENGEWKANSIKWLPK